MSVSARTFQLLYIVRQRALLDKPTSSDDFAEFVHTRRKSAPALYSQAYISPSAIEDSLQRMTTEGLVIQVDGVYNLTPMGSQMADILDGIDACTDKFLLDYKEEVTRGVLKQQARLGGKALNVREIAGIANISLDSARRGLVDLYAKGEIVEIASGRSNVYTLATPPMEPVVQAPQTDDDDGVRAALRTLAEDEDVPISKAPEEDTVPLGAVLQDEGPDHEPEDAPPQAEEAPPQTGHWQARWVVGEPPKAGPTVSFASWAPDQEAPDQEAPEPAKDPEDLWGAVPPRIRQKYLDAAKVTGLGLNEFLNLLIENARVRMRQAALYQGALPEDTLRHIIRTAR